MTLAAARAILETLDDILWEHEHPLGAAELHQLVAAEELVQALPGVYVKTRRNEYIKGAFPVAAPERVAREFWARQGEIIMVHGADAVRYMRLSTQMALKPIFYSSGPSCSMKPFGSHVIFHHAPAWVTAHAGSDLEVPVAALHYYGLRHADALLKAVRDEHMPQLAAVIEQHRAREEATKLVKDGLLELTGGNAEQVSIWLEAPHHALDGATPQELLDGDEFEVVAELVDHMLSGAPA